MLHRNLTIVGLWLLATSQAFAQSSYPMLMSLKPVAVQRGTTTECEVRSRYTLLGAHQVFISGNGVSVDVVPPDLPAVKEGEKPKEITAIKLRFTVDADAESGPRQFRLATPNGASTVGQLVVVEDPVVVEQAKNDTLAEAQVVTLPAALCGAIEKNEDTDFWKFHVEAGQSFVFHVQSQRLEDRIHDLQTHVDPILFLRDAGGSVIAMSDNHFYADPFLTHTFEQAGDYVLEIRDVRYTGNTYWEYCIEAHSRPFVTQVFPLAVARDQETPVELTGSLLSGVKQPLLNAAGGEPGFRDLAVNLGDGRLSNPVSVQVTDLPLMTEPVTAHGTIETAVPVEIPCVMNGRLGVNAELDVYSFEAKKGDLLQLEILARRFGSNLDSYVRILNAQGKPLKEDDDASFLKLQSSDTLMDGWAVPADGRYFVEIRDVHLRGGEGYTYALQLQRCQPGFTLAIDTDKTNVTPGTHGVIFVRAERKHGFSGRIALEIEGLPEGVFATCGEILDGKGRDGAIIIGAEEGAPPGMSRIRIRGKAEHPQAGGEPVQLVAEGQPFQEIYMPGGGRSHFAVADHVVCVGAPSDIRKITLSETDLHLKPGESRPVTVRIERAPDSTANISLDFLFLHLNTTFANTLPEGVTIDKAKSKTLLSNGATEGLIMLKADPKAEPVDRQLCSLMAHFSINFVMKATYSSPPIWISVDAGK